MFADIKTSLHDFGVDFDVYFHEDDLHSSGAVTAAVDELKALGHLYLADGAWWLRSTDYGDDKDRVVIKSDGQPAYIAGDLAYFKDKRARGFDLCIYLLGADHHGYIARLKAAAAAFGDDPDTVEVLIGQLVNLVKDGQPLRMSKRAGTVVTMEDLVSAVGIDAARYALVRSSADSTLDIDLDLLTKATNDNPVFYVQYAHARSPPSTGRPNGWWTRRTSGLAPRRSASRSRPLSRRSAWRSTSTTPARRSCARRWRGGCPTRGSGSTRAPRGSSPSPSGPAFPVRTSGSTATTSPMARSPAHWITAWGGSSSTRPRRSPGWPMPRRSAGFALRSCSASRRACTRAGTRSSRRRTRTRSSVCPSQAVRRSPRSRASSRARSSSCSVSTATSAPRSRTSQPSKRPRDGCSSCALRSPPPRASWCPRSTSAAGTASATAQVSVGCRSGSRPRRSRRRWIRSVRSSAPRYRGSRSSQAGRSRAPRPSPCTG